MSKHDSWATLKPHPAFDEVKHLFPNGVPLRDPFPTVFVGKKLGGFIIDHHRLSHHQLFNLIKAIASKNNATFSEVDDNFKRMGQFGIHVDSIEEIKTGVEGFVRSLEALKFFSEVTPESPGANQRLTTFINNQTHRWIEGDEQPDLKAAWERFPEHLKDEENTATYKQHLIHQHLSNNDYSAFDMLMGDAMVNALNEADPDHQYSLVTDDDDDDDDDDDGDWTAEDVELP